MTRAAWRRAIAHVLRAANINDVERSLDKLDALGAGFRWTNGPRGYKGWAYTWRKMVDLLLPNGPTGLHLTDLHDVQLVCNRAKAVAEKDKKGSRPAKNLAAAEEKTATSSRSDRLRTNDMETNDTTADDYSMAPSMSNSVPGTAASTPAGPAATSAATLGRRRSNRRAVAPTL